MRKMLFACANRLRKQSSVSRQAVACTDSIVVIPHAKVPLVKFDLKMQHGPGFQSQVTDQATCWQRLKGGEFEPTV
jgi:hypothetical protein